MKRLRTVPPLAALILMLFPACDNVQWGGAQVTVVPPPPKPGEETVDDGPVAERLPEGPVLYYVQARAGQALLVPVAEIERDTLVPVRATADWERYGQLFIAEHLRHGTEFVVFRGGARAGTFVLDSAGVPGEAVCPRVPRATGTLELAAGAAGATEFLAIAKAQAPADLPRPTGSELEVDGRMRLLAPILAERLLRARNAPLPGNWTRAMAQLEPFPAGDDAEGAAFASTFLLSDSLAAGPDDEGYALFFIARPVEQVGYDTAYAAFTDYSVEGKAAPRLVDHLDWDRDGQAELLLEVYGTQGSWFEAVDRTDAGWTRVLANLCGRPRPAPADSLAAAAPGVTRRP